MLCVRVIATSDEGSRFGDIEVEQTEAPYTQNVPPMLVSQPLPVAELVFLTVPDDVRTTEPHPAPRRQFCIVLDGEFEIETSDGDRRTFTSGDIALLEDTTGRGHVTRVLRGPASFVAVSLADSHARHVTAETDRRAPSLPSCSSTAPGSAAGRGSGSRPTCALPATTS